MRAGLRDAPPSRLAQQGLCPPSREPPVTSSVVQWLRTCLAVKVDAGLILVWGTKSPYSAEILSLHAATRVRMQ